MANPAIRFSACMALLGTVFAAAQQPGTEWPAVRDGLLFAFTTAFEPAYALDNAGKPLPGWKFTPRGSGRFNHDGALQFFPGGFRAEGLSEFWGKSLDASREVTLSFRLAGESASQSGLILSLGGALPLVRVEQHWKSMRIFAGDDANHVLEFTFDGKPATLAVTMGSGEIAAYLNGVEKASAAANIADESWHAPALHVGHASQPLVGEWNGAVEHIALYDRALDAGAVAAYTAAVEERIAARAPVDRLIVRARLSGKSTIPTEESIAPYTQGLCVFRYEVLEVIQGAYKAPHIHVAHWMVLDKNLFGFHRYPEGREFTLKLEPFDDNPQLKSEYLSDDVVEDFSLPYYFDAVGLSCFSAPGIPEN